MRYGAGLGRVVKLVHTAVAAQGFAGWDPGSRFTAPLLRPHGGSVPHTAPEGPRTRIHNYVLGSFREKTETTNQPTLRLLESCTDFREGRWGTAVTE